MRKSEIIVKEGMINFAGGRGLFDGNLKRIAFEHSNIFQG